MPRALLLALLALLLGVAAPDVAAAQACPPGAIASGTAIPGGTRVKILEVSSADAYHGERSEIVGKVGRVDRLDPTGGCWFGGQFYGDDGSSYYFYQVAVSREGSPTGCPAGASTGGPIESGSRVRVLTVSPEDAYHPTRHTIEGQLGRVEGAWTKTGEPCWYSGEFLAEDGRELYFYQAAVEVLGAGDMACPRAAFTGAGLADGTRVRLLTVSPNDAYHPTRATLEGKVGRVSGAWDKMEESCWFSGQFEADDGSSNYFYQAAVEVLHAEAPPAASTACPPGASLRASIPGGTKVKILAVHPEDAYYGSAADHIGLTGTVEGALHSNDGCWMGGGFVADDGSSHYYYKAAVVEVSVPAERTGTACPSGASTVASIPGGTKVKIVGLHPEDAFFPDAAAYIGKTGTVEGDLHSNDGCWMGGGFVGEDGSSVYFYKAAVQTLGGPTAGGRYTGAAIAAGQRFRIVAVDEEDAYYDTRADMIGKTCAASERMSAESEGWYSGPVRCEDGTEYYFFKVGVVLK